jgi:hypothetical protein
LWSQVGSLETLYEKYGDRIDFYFIYVSEAHPTQQLPEAWSFWQRGERAEMLCQELQMSIPVLLDDAEKNFEKAYRVFSERAVLIDHGKIAFFSDNEMAPEGPQADMAQNLEKAIVELLGARQQELVIAAAEDWFPDAS